MYNDTDNEGHYSDTINTRGDQDGNHDLGGGGGRTYCYKTENWWCAADNFKVKEHVDEKVSDDLADMMNCIFRDGISNERYHELMKSVKR